ncbi:pyrimidine 2 [Prunus dulcis]|uniref:Pyrimidine 2 n=1 Tax=Prunus dulcis TaxID=3755 RepID=A0A4Y1RA73_PRUDU|nr:pyrimidine 2 [Prunus dulcis]
MAKNKEKEGKCGLYEEEKEKKVVFLRVLKRGRVREEWAFIARFQRQTVNPAPPQPPSATVVAGNFHETGRVRQFFRKFVGARSPSFLNQIDRVGAGGRAVEVRGIHHRANYSFRAKGDCLTGENFGMSKYRGDSAEFSAEV